MSEVERTCSLQQVLLVEDNIVSIKVNSSKSGPKSSCWCTSCLSGLMPSLSIKSYMTLCAIHQVCMTVTLRQSIHM